MISYLKKLLYTNQLMGMDSDGESIDFVEIDKIDDDSIYLDSYISTQGNNIKQIMPYNKLVATALPFSSVIIKSVPFHNKIDDNDIISLLRLNAEKYIGCDPDSVLMDYNLSADNINIVAARKELIANHISFLDKSKLKPKIIDVDILAFARVIMWLTSKAKLNHIAINIDKNRMFLIVIINNKLNYYQAEYFHESEWNNDDYIINMITYSLEVALASGNYSADSIVLSGILCKEYKLKERLEEQFELPATYVELDKIVKYKESIKQINLVTLGLAMRKFSNE